MTDTVTDTSSGTQRDIAKRSLPGVRGEVTLVVLGLYTGFALYYSKHSPWALIGLIGLTFVALYAAYSIRRVNPTTLPELNITRKRAGLYLLVGLILILPAWFFDSVYSYLTGKGWLSLGIATSPSLILSILAVATCEEVFFRGYLLGRIKSLGGKRWWRILLLSAIFMLYKVVIHSWDGWPLATYATFFGFGVFKMLFETFWVDWTGSIVTSTVIHIGWDLIMFQEYSGLPPWAL